MRSQSQQHGQVLTISSPKVSSSSPESNTGGGAIPSIQDLPNEALALVLEHCPDLESITNLAQAAKDHRPSVRRAIYHENLLSCDRCKNPFFSDEDLSIVAPHTKAFSCSVCHQKLCGYLLFDYDRKGCKPQVCDGCGKIECMRCMQAHATEEQSDGYGTENYCEDCQGEFEFGMGGC